MSGPVMTCARGHVPIPLYRLSILALPPVQTTVFVYRRIGAPKGVFCVPPTLLTDCIVGFWRGRRMDI